MMLFMTVLTSTIRKKVINKYSEWIKRVQNLYLSRNAFELAAVFENCKCYLDHFVRI